MFLLCYLDISWVHYFSTSKIRLSADDRINKLIVIEIHIEISSVFILITQIVIKLAKIVVKYYYYILAACLKESCVILICLIKEFYLFVRV